MPRSLEDAKVEDLKWEMGGEEASPADAKDGMDEMEAIMKGKLIVT